jgi:hypothetical protein
LSPGKKKKKRNKKQVAYYNIHENPAMESSFKRKLATIQEIAYIFTISMHNSTFKVLCALRYLKKSS